MYCKEYYSNCSILTGGTRARQTTLPFSLSTVNNSTATEGALVLNCFNAVSRAFNTIIINETNHTE